MFKAGKRKRWVVGTWLSALSVIQRWCRKWQIKVSFRNCRDMKSGRSCQPWVMIATDQEDNVRGTGNKEVSFPLVDLVLDDSDTDQARLSFSYVPMKFKHSEILSSLILIDIIIVAGGSYFYHEPRQEFIFRRKKITRRHSCRDISESYNSVEIYFCRISAFEQFSSFHQPHPVRKFYCPFPVTL